MFPSQPQIGQDMAKERQRLAARIRQAESASAAHGPKRVGSAWRRWIDGTMLMRRLVGIIIRFGDSGSK